MHTDDITDTSNTSDDFDDPLIRSVMEVVIWSTFIIVGMW